jgi:hypothetical protein
MATVTGIMGMATGIATGMATGMATETAMVCGLMGMET